MNLSDKVPILILGGSGFLGTNITAALLEKDYLVSVLDIKLPSNPIKNVNYLIQDIGNKEVLEEAIKQNQYIIYLNSSTSPESSMSNPQKAYTEDLPLLISVCDLCVKHGLKKIIYASSGGTVYESSTENKPFCEDDSLYPINHYGVVKVASEKILMLYNKLHNMKNIVLRISNPYGRGQDSNSGVGAITAFTKKILNNETISLFGDGSIVRDYVAISDVANAFVLALNDIKESGSLPIYNIGSGQGISIYEIITYISKQLNREAKIKYLPSRQFDVPYNVLNIDKSAQELLYTPKVDTLQGIQDYITMLSNTQ